MFGFRVEKLYAGTNKKFKILGLILILIGIAGVTFPFWNVSLLSEPEPNALEQLGTSELEAQAIAPSFLFPVEDKITPVPGAASAPINRLVIEGANINMPLFVSDNEKVLLKGGWVFAGTSRPDKGSNTVIFGHRWLYKPPVKNTFYDLDKVTAGSKFTISWNGKTHNYEVSEVKVVNPTDVWVMNPTDTPQVTLITCTPLFSTKQRLVVVGKLI